MDIICRDTARRYREVRKILKGSTPEYHQQDLKESTKTIFSAVIRTICLMLALVMFIIGLFESKGHAEDCVTIRSVHGIKKECQESNNINLDIIADIESSHEPLAYNRESGATGEYQITQGVIYDFNSEMFENGLGIHYSLDDMYSPKKSHNVAQWFINNKIPSELQVYGIPDTITSRIVGYNWGIGHLRRWFKQGSHWNGLPIETRKYIRRYYKEMKGE